MDERVDRLLRKAEEAADRNDLDQSDTYRILAGHVDFLRRKEAKELEKVFERSSR